MINWLKNLFRLSPRKWYAVKYVALGEAGVFTVGLFRDEARAYEVVGRRMTEVGAYDTYRFFVEEVGGK